jgi:hypothetical protein
MLHAHVPRGRWATSGQPNQSCRTMKRHDVAHFLRCDRAVIDHDHL